MLLDRPCRLYEVHDFDAFYVTMFSSWKHMRYPTKESETCMEVLLSEHPHRFLEDHLGGIGGLIQSLRSFSGIFVDVFSDALCFFADTRVGFAALYDSGALELVG